MPIKIVIADSHEQVTLLASDTWELPAQIDALEQWLESEAASSAGKSLVADICYAPREGALGGGCHISTSMMKKLIALNIQLCLSEYPPE